MNCKRLIAAGVAFVLAVAHASSVLAAPRIDSIDPTTVQQGDTVLLTIKGRELPVGNLRLEFFPQQIVVINAQLSSAPDELTAQIRVPQLATPGAYNIMISNQLGDEAFGQSLLTVTSTVRTPVFKSYDPKVIARADNGFALMLLGESITPETPGQLSVAWEQNGKAVGGLQTAFSYSSGAIIAAVTGRLPTGMLRGKVSMAGKPVYQLEIEVRGGTAVIGHVPTRLNSVDGMLSLKLVGDDLSSGWLSRATVTLRAGKREVTAARLAWKDRATAEAQFLGPLPAADWTLAVTVEGVAVYEGKVTILPPLPVPQKSQLPEPPVIPEVAQDPQPLTSAVITEVDDPAVFPPADPASLLESADPPPGFEMTEVRVGGTAVPEQSGPSIAEAHGPALITGAKFVPGRPGSTARLELSGNNLTPELLERLDVEIAFKGGKLRPALSSATADGFSYVFESTGALPAATLTVRDPQGVVPLYQQALGKQPAQAQPVVQPLTPEPEVKLPVNTVSEQLEVVLDGPVKVETAGFALTLTTSGEVPDWSAAKLTSAHPILAPNVGKFTVDAPLSGTRTVVKLRRDASSLPDMVYDVLCTMLIESASVPLRFEWPDGRSAELNATFAAAAPELAEDESLAPTSGLLK